MLLSISNPRHVTIECGHLQFGMLMDALITIGVVWDVHGCPNHCRSIFSFTYCKGTTTLSYRVLAISHPYFCCFEITLMYITLCRTARLENKDEAESGCYLLFDV